jgi:hypothetical protein
VSPGIFERLIHVDSHGALFGLLAVAFLAPPVRPQSSVTTRPEIPPGDRSFNLNQPVDDPEAISGAWEATDGHGGAVGIHLHLATTAPSDADPPVWTPQCWQDLELGVFQSAKVPS